MDLRFTKMQGCGNDFVVIDDLATEWDFDEAAVRLLCDRHFGVGADGLILASPVYYENVSAQMKLFIDRNATRYFHDERLAPRAVGLVAVSAESGLGDTLAALRRFVALSVREVPPVLTLGGFADVPGEAAQNAELMAEARALGRSMAELLDLPSG